MSLNLSKVTDGDAGFVGGLAVAGLARPPGEAGALTADALAVSRADLVVDAVAREVVALAVLSAEELGRVGAGLALADAAEAVAPVAAEDVRGVVRLAQRFQVSDVGVAGALAVLSATLVVARADAALQVAAVVAILGIRLESLR